jgi:glutamate dehydrogenase/leucine dehydrogenase
MQGVVVIDSTALGPGKGGIRMTSTVDVREAAKMARSMTWKCALAKLPFGGAKSGLIANSKRIDPVRKKRYVEAFSRAIRVVCPDMYVAAPDMYMGEQEMEWFAKANGDFSCCTGKPAALGGIPHELGGTGYGVFHATRVAAEMIGLDLSKATFAVEGFGNVGRPLAKFLCEAGAKFVAVSDSQGTIYKPEGLDFDVLAELKAKGASVISYADFGGGEICDQSSCDRILDVHSDILIPAAKPDLIHYRDVDRLRFKLIVEGSNISMSFAVENLCFKKGITVIPDFVANAGGVISSYVEYIKGEPTLVYDLVEKTITENTRTILQKSREENRMPRKVALNLAMESLNRVY